MAERTGDGETHSSKSSTPNSASTYEYSHEPFETFQKKIAELANQIGASEVISIGRLRGGSFNRVISATLHCVGLLRTPISGVFRVPRFQFDDDDDDDDDDNDNENENVNTNNKSSQGKSEKVDSRIHDQLATLSLVAANGIPVPQVLAWDATANNAIHSSYVFQELATGTRLSDIYANMSLQEKLSIVDEMVNLLIQMEAVRFRQAGKIQRDESATDLKAGCPQKHDLHPHERPEALIALATVVGFGVGSGDVAPTKPSDSPSKIFTEQLDTWIEHLHATGDRQEVKNDFLRLRKIAQSMESLGFFDQNAGQSSLRRSWASCLLSVTTRFHGRLSGETLHYITSIIGFGIGCFTFDQGNSSFSKVWYIAHIPMFAAYLILDNLEIPFGTYPIHIIGFLIGCYIFNQDPSSFGKAKFVAYAALYSSSFAVSTLCLTWMLRRIAGGTSTEEGHSILFHSDLMPRNILAVPVTGDSAPSGHKRWKISSVLDWDDSLALPPVLTRKPPAWLWDFSLEDFKSQSVPDFYDGDLDLLPPDRYGDSSARLSDENRSIKKHFEYSFVRKLQLMDHSMTMEKYQDETYGRGRWMRRLLRFATQEISSSEDLKRLWQFQDDWEDLEHDMERSRLSKEIQQPPIRAQTRELNGEGDKHKT